MHHLTQPPSLLLFDSRCCDETLFECERIWLYQMLREPGAALTLCRAATGYEHWCVLGAWMHESYSRVQKGSALYAGRCYFACICRMKHGHHNRQDDFLRLLQVSCVARRPEPALPVGNSKNHQKRLASRTLGTGCSSSAAVPQPEGARAIEQCDI